MGVCNSKDVKGATDASCTVYTNPNPSYASRKSFSNTARNTPKFLSTAEDDNVKALAYNLPQHTIASPAQQYSRYLGTISESSPSRLRSHGFKSDTYQIRSKSADSSYDQARKYCLLHMNLPHDPFYEKSTPARRSVGCDRRSSTRRSINMNESASSLNPSPRFVSHSHLRLLRSFEESRSLPVSRSNSRVQNRSLPSTRKRISPKPSNALPYNNDGNAHSGPLDCKLKKYLQQEDEKAARNALRDLPNHVSSWDCSHPRSCHFETGLSGNKDNPELISSRPRCKSSDGLCNEFRSTGSSPLERQRHKQFRFPNAEGKGDATFDSFHRKLQDASSSTSKPRSRLKADATPTHSGDTIGGRGRGRGRGRGEGDGDADGISSWRRHLQLKEAAKEAFAACPSVMGYSKGRLHSQENLPSGGSSSNISSDSRCNSTLKNLEEDAYPYDIIRDQIKPSSTPLDSKYVLEDSLGRPLLNIHGHLVEVDLGHVIAAAVNLEDAPNPATVLCHQEFHAQVSNLKEHSPFPLNYHPDDDNKEVPGAQVGPELVAPAYCIKTKHRDDKSTTSASNMSMDLLALDAFLDKKSLDVNIYVTPLPFLSPRTSAQRKW